MLSIHRIALIGALLLMAGCETKTTVSGTVTYNGEPVQKGYMSFAPSGGKGQSFAAPIVDGQYSVAEAAPGQMTAVATGSREIDHYASSADAYASGGGDRAHTTADADYIAADAEGNSQQVEIKPGAQVFDLAITGPPAPK